MHCIYHHSRPRQLAQITLFIQHVHMCCVGLCDWHAAVAVHGPPLGPCAQDTALPIHVHACRCACSTDHVHLYSWTSGHMHMLSHPPSTRACMLLKLSKCTPYTMHATLGCSQCAHNTPFMLHWTAVVLRSPTWPMHMTTGVCMCLHTYVSPCAYQPTCIHRWFWSV